MTKSIDIIVGARPNFIKVAGIIKELQRMNAAGHALHYRLVHTSQHYDKRMSGIFFEELQIPEPDVVLNVGAVRNGIQVGRMMAAYSEVLEAQRPDMVVVSGDVNSTVACALAAKKTDPAIRLVHIEAGLRSRDLSMPEEVNRIITDSLSDYFFTTSRSASRNLLDEKVEASRIFFVGNTMIDTHEANKDRFRKPRVWEEQGLRAGEYIVLTLHRQANISERGILQQLLESVNEAAGHLPVIFPVHPHTAKMMCDFQLSSSGMILTEPMGYLEFNYLVRHSKAVVTDSGGISEEATVMNVPCMTLRHTTERPETCSLGTNLLLGTSAARIAEAFQRLYSGQWQPGGIPELWDGRSAGRIVRHLYKILYGTQAASEPLVMPRSQSVTELVTMFNFC